MNAVARSVAATYLRSLSGFRGYPRSGEERFIEVLQEVSISVDHCRAIMESFDGEFPTLKEIRDVAYSMRPKFERAADQRKEWERQYGKPDPNWSRNLVSGSFAEQKRKMMYQRIRDIIYYTEGPGRSEKHDAEFWTRAALTLRRDHSEELQRFREELSRGWEDLMRDDWVNELPPSPITLEDQERRDKIRRDVKALASGDKDDDTDRWE